MTTNQQKMKVNASRWRKDSSEKKINGDNNKTTSIILFVVNDD